MTASAGVAGVVAVAVGWGVTWPLGVEAPPRESTKAAVPARSSVTNATTAPTSSIGLPTRVRGAGVGGPAVRTGADGGRVTNAGGDAAAGICGTGVGIGDGIGVGGI